MVESTILRVKLNTRSSKFVQTTVSFDVTVFFRSSLPRRLSQRSSYDSIVVVLVKLIVSCTAGVVDSVDRGVVKLRIRGFW